MRREQLKHIVIGAVIALAIIAPLGAYGFVASGIFDVGASSPHTKFTQWITHDTMIHSVRRHAKSIAPPKWTSAAQLESGFCTYETHCAACHGAAAVARQHWVSGMEPQPPYLLDVQQKFTAPQLFWIVKNGIKMTAMPEWGDSMDDRDIWNVVAWLEASSKLPPPTYVRWQSTRRCGTLIGLSSPSAGSFATPRP